MDGRAQPPDGGVRRVGRAAAANARTRGRRARGRRARWARGGGVGGWGTRWRGKQLGVCPWRTHRRSVLAAGGGGGGGGGLACADGSGGGGGDRGGGPGWRRRRLRRWLAPPLPPPHPHLRRRPPRDPASPRRPVRAAQRGRARNGRRLACRPPRPPRSGGFPPGSVMRVGAITYCAAKGRGEGEGGGRGGGRLLLGLVDAALGARTRLATPACTRKCPQRVRFTAIGHKLITSERMAHHATKKEKRACL